MTLTVLKWVAAGMVVLLFLLWLWSGGLSAVVRFVKTIPNPIDIIWGNSSSTYQIVLPWQIAIPQGPDISGLTEDGSAYAQNPEDELADLQRQYDELAQEAQKQQVSGITSPYAKNVSLSAAAATEDSPNAEYLVIESRGGNVSLNNWSLVSMLSGIRVFLPQAAAPYAQGAVNAVQPVQLGSGESAVVITGVSPVGVSFQENRCTGYLAQNQSFEPSLSNACPSAADAMPLNEQNLQVYGSECIDYVRRIPNCTFPSEVPASLNNNCRAFIVNTLSHNGCVNTYRSQPNFTLDTWRLYLGYNAPIWNDGHDVIRLLDESGRTVDSITY